jgi:hypothetical protein
MPTIGFTDISKGTWEGKVPDNFLEKKKVTRLTVTANCEIRLLLWSPANAAGAGAQLVALAGGEMFSEGR